MNRYLNLFSSKGNKDKLKINAGLNVIKKTILLVFPLITFPYISRVLGVENLGKFNYAYSLISWFVLFASLGIPIYSASYGARIRDDKERSDRFVSDLILISLITTVIAYIVFAIMLAVSVDLREYNSLLLILSVIIAGTTLGLDWYFVIYEEYFYITVRVIIIQLVSLALIFGFVHNSSDLFEYAWVYVFSQVGASAINIYIVCRRVKFGFEFSSLKKHVKPILTTFALCMSSQIYINADMTMVGAMQGDYYTGLYSVSNKVYRVLKSLMAALYEAALPNLSNAITSEGMDSFKVKINELLNTIVVFLIPAVCGVIATSSDIIYVVGGSEYMEASTSLAILGFSLLFAALSGAFMYAVLLPMKLEKVTMQSMTVSAVINIALNFYFIPRYNINGAAITTAISEGIVFIWQCIYVSRYKILEVELSNVLQVALGSGCIFLCCGLVSTCDLPFIVSLLLKIIVSVVVYALVLIVTKNKYLRNIFKKAR